jgi:glycosyltransferase involved in cell wall biosynthesis
MIKVLGLEKNIELTGELPHSSVLELMQLSKVFLHTSAYEGFVVVCLEALYAGAQVVSMVRPMEVPIENWHVIQKQVDMAHKIKELLEDTAINYKPVLPYAIHDTAKAMMQLFDQNKD